METGTQLPVQQTAEQFLQQLRLSTDPQHKQLESNQLANNLLSDKVGLSDYAAYLLAMKDVVAFTESTIFPIVKELFPDTEERRKLGLIEKDIRFLSSYVHQLPNKKYEPLGGGTSLPFALGYMYVVEGSSLGGRVILKHLQPKISVDENNGAAYFAGYGEGTGKYWKSFLNNFTGYVVSNDCAAEVIEGAKHAFASIHEHFEQLS